MPDREFKPGFRLSIVDVGVLLIGIPTIVWLSRDVPVVAFVVAFALGHFFLFCNVFRISRPPELIWAGVFTGLASATISSGTPGWAITIALSLAVTVAVVLVEMRKPSYHGVGWKKINPGLIDWWKHQSDGRALNHEQLEKAIRRQTRPGPHSDSAELIREDRDR